MKNFIQPGVNLDCVAPYDLASGDGFLDGAVFGVAATAALSGQAVEGVTAGVFALKKAAVAITRMTVAYWDNTAKAVTNVATNNTKIGIFQAGALSGAATVAVKLVASI